MFTLKHLKHKLEPIIIDYISSEMDKEQESILYVLEKDLSNEYLDYIYTLNCTNVITFIIENGYIFTPNNHTLLIYYMLYYNDIDNIEKYKTKLDNDSFISFIIDENCIESKENKKFDTTQFFDYCIETLINNNKQDHIPLNNYTYQLIQHLLTNKSITTIISNQSYTNLKFILDQNYTNQNQYQNQYLTNPSDSEPATRVLSIILRHALTHKSFKLWNIFKTYNCSTCQENIHSLLTGYLIVNSDNNDTFTQEIKHFMKQ